MAFAECCMMLSAAGCVYLFFMGCMVASNAVGLDEYIHDEEGGGAAALFLASAVYAVIFGIIIYSKYFMKRKNETIEKFIQRIEKKNPHYYQLDDMSHINRQKPQEVL